jgi:hypothetical protein
VQVSTQPSVFGPPARKRGQVPSGRQWRSDLVADAAHVLSQKSRCSPAGARLMIECRSRLTGLSVEAVARFAIENQMHLPVASPDALHFRLTAAGGTCAVP